MSRVLILYGTTDGHTARIGRFLDLELQRAGAEVDLIEAGTLDTEPRPDHYDGVIVAASVHVHGYQRAVRRWVTAHAPTLRTRPTAFISVSLGVLQEDPAVKLAVDSIVQHFLDGNEWHPTFVKSVAGALPYTHYGFLKRLVMRHIARKAGGDTDITRDYEYTDWSDLETFAVEFYGALAGGREGGRAEENEEVSSCSCSCRLQESAGEV